MIFVYICNSHFFSTIYTDIYFYVHSAGSTPNGTLGELKFWRPPEYWCSGQLVESLVKILVRLFYRILFLKITVLCMYFILIIFALAPP